MTGYEKSVTIPTGYSDKSPTLKCTGVISPCAAAVWWCSKIDNSTEESTVPMVINPKSRVSGFISEDYLWALADLPHIDGISDISYVM